MWADLIFSSSDVTKRRQGARRRTTAERRQRRWRRIACVPVIHTGRMNSAFVRCANLSGVCIV